MSQCGYWIFPTMILIMISCSGEKNDKQTDPVMSAYEQEIFDLINQYRQENGKALLKKPLPAPQTIKNLLY